VAFARNIRVVVIFNKVDISDEIAHSISSLNYTDNSKNAIDDLELELENLDYRWLKEWYPDENSRLLIGIQQNENGKSKFLDLGIFYVDEPTFNNQRLSLKCLALPLDQTIREQVNSVAWEKITLSELLSKITVKHELDYELHCDNAFFDRLDQDRETDLGFLNRVLSETALSLKVTDDKLIVFNDDAKSILIEDPSGNSFFMDGKGNIEVNAPKNISFTAGEDISMKATKNITLNAGQDYNLTTANNMSTKVGNDSSTNIVNRQTYSSGDYTENVRGNKKVVITGDLDETTASYNHNAISGDATIQSAGVSKVLGKKDALVNIGSV